MKNFVVALDDGVDSECDWECCLSQLLFVFAAVMQQYPPRELPFLT
jgi:hypothetical protein